MFRTVRTLLYDVSPLKYPLLAWGLGVLYWGTLLISIYVFAAYIVAVPTVWCVVMWRNFKHHGIKYGGQLGWDRQMQAFEKLFQKGDEIKRAKRRYLRSMLSRLRQLF
ncbi:MAG TPA: hypothetical protein VFE98_00585 [Candidatus Bathyarchaeia archaeon]|nr:hypothetical protein [Candidatus Bathyarchaeia archaeon]